MEDSLTILLIILSIVPLFAIVLGLWHEISNFMSERRIELSEKSMSSEKQAEYERIAAATKELEMDFQPNTGIHHPEEVYLNRAELIRKETHWYNMINSL